MKTQCPHCQSPCTIKRTEQITLMYREITFQCSNIQCGHIFIASIEPIRTLSLSSIPDPNIRLPLSTHIKKKQVEKMLTNP